MTKHNLHHWQSNPNLDLEFTKIILKIVIMPFNYPMGKCLPRKYEIAWEFKCLKNEVKNIEDQYLFENITTDFDEVFSNLIENTNFAIKTKTILFNYETLQEKLGYAPDALEFDSHLKNILNSYGRKIQQNEMLNIVA